MVQQGNQMAAQSWPGTVSAQCVDTGGGTHMRQYSVKALCMSSLS